MLTSVMRTRTQNFDIKVLGFYTPLVSNPLHPEWLIGYPTVLNEIFPSWCFLLLELSQRIAAHKMTRRTQDACENEGERKIERTKRQRVCWPGSSSGAGRQGLRSTHSQRKYF